MSAVTDASEWCGLKAVDHEGDSIGDVENAYGTTDDGWLMIKTGLLGRKSYMVPTHGAAAEDGQVRLPWSKDHIKDSPEVPSDGTLPEEVRDQIDAHYSGAPTGTVESTDGMPAEITENVDGSERPPVESTDDAPVTYDENSEIRDPDRGTRRESKDMVLPEHHKGIRPHPKEDPTVDTTGPIAAPTGSDDPPK